MPKNIPIWAVKRFIKTWRNLSGSQKQRIGEILIALPDLMLNPHLHTGYGLRQLHGTHFHEVRLDLRWRLIFKVYEEEIVLFDVMNHQSVGPRSQSGHNLTRHCARGA
jgi:mRNA-degrading endonuclease RelE of RelBE toxin-antitoxin system